MNSSLLAIRTLWIREVVRFYRDRSRVIGAIVPPVVFWFLIGSALGGGSGTAGGSNTYLQSLFPGTILLIVLFTAVFSTISIIEDRREGFLQGVLVAPVPRSTIVLGKIAGGATLAFLQALTFLIIAPFVGVPLAPERMPFVLAELWLSACALTGFGFWIAWRMDSTQGFHAIMNLLLIPMWMLSGSVFPISGAPTWLRWIMTVNPVTYCAAALQHGLAVGTSSGLPSPALSFIVTGLFCIAMVAASTWEVGREGRR
ncbi:MAG: ABC transporter permease [Elusimicrobia bacterium]|nr:ABC transporter permease [Elusimicrobiota bacterium]